MKKHFKYFLFLFVFSCGHIQFDVNGIKSNEQVTQKISNKELWKGKPSADVMTHKIFAVLPLEKRIGKPGSEVLVFKNSGGQYSSSNCAAYGNWGGCNALGSEIICNHVFTVVNEKIVDYDRIGACLEEEQPKFAPLQNLASKSLNDSKRAPASVEIKRLIDIDERSGCCSHHGGVSHCSAGTLYCSDGWTSGCGC